MKFILFLLLAFSLQQTFQQDFYADCSDSLPTLAYCDIDKKCTNCKNLECQYCELDLVTCTQCSPQPCSTCKSNDGACEVCGNGSSTYTPYFYKKTCSQQKPGGVICDKDTHICKDGDAITYDSQVYTEQKIQQIEAQVTSTTATAVAGTVILSTAQNFVSSASFGIINMGLTCQKLAYLILIDSPIPKQIFAALVVVKGQIPSQQFSFLNMFQSTDSSDDDSYHNRKFKSVNLHYSVLTSCGAGLSLFLIFGFLFVLFYVLLVKITNPTIVTHSKKAYQSVFSAFIVQYIQMAFSTFVIGINIQFKEFFNHTGIEELAPKIIVVLVLLPLCYLISQQMYFYLNLQKPPLKVVNFQEINREKILNETIFDSKLRRNYMLIYQLFESILIPTAIIQLSASYKACFAITLILEIAHLIIIALIKPFLSRITNGFFIINSLFWIALDIEFFVMSTYTSKEDPSQFARILDSTSRAFLVFIQLLLLSQPIYMGITLLVKLVDFIKQKIKERNQTKTETEVADAISFSSNYKDINELKASIFTSSGSYSSQKSQQSNSANQSSKSVELVTEI